MSDCLLRVSEAVAVNVEDIEENSLTVYPSKTDQTSETKTLYIGDRTKRLIKRWANFRAFVAGGFGGVTCEKQSFYRRNASGGALGVKRHA